MKNISNKYDDQLLGKRVVDMTGDELVSLIRGAVAVSSETTVLQKERKLLHGKKEISNALSVSISTVSRWLAEGTIKTPAVTRAGRVLLFDYDLVLEQLQESDGLRWASRVKK